jgi:transcriptional regulator with XRE-family HTH domain
VQLCAISVNNVCVFESIPLYLKSKTELPHSGLVPQIQGWDSYVALFPRTKVNIFTELSIGLVKIFTQNFCIFMKSADFKRFIFENKIKQSLLAEYLGVSEGYISSVASGRKQLSEEKLSKVLNNPYGWDVSMLVPQAPDDRELKIHSVKADYSRYIGESFSLVDLLRIKDEEIIRLHKRIWELEQSLESKGGCYVQGADSSSDAHAG